MSPYRIAIAHAKIQWHASIRVQRCLCIRNLDPDLEFVDLFTVFENHRKSLIQHCERSELSLHFEWTIAKLSILRLFENPKFAVKQFYQNGQFQLDINW